MGRLSWDGARVGSREFPLCISCNSNRGDTSKRNYDMYRVFVNDRGAVRNYRIEFPNIIRI